jgi:hypothetical protein
MVACMYMPSKYDSETVGNVLDAMERWGFGPNNRNVFCILTLQENCDLASKFLASDNF